jgi:hypothetical protein
MGVKMATEPARSAELDIISKRRRQYGCDPYEFAGSDNALYERHLVFDNVVDPAAAGPRERFEAFARAVRDVLSQRWSKTEDTYARQDPKRVYYLSMEFLIGRSLANNVTNLLLDPVVSKAVEDDHIDWLGMLDQEPDAGLGNGGGDVWRLVSSTPWRRCSCRPWATACDTSTASSSSRSGTAGNWNSRTIGCAGQTPGR